MNFLVVFIILFPVISLFQHQSIFSSGKKICRDVQKEIEAEHGQNGTLRFIFPRSNDISENWLVRGPDGFTMCENVYGPLNYVFVKYISQRIEDCHAYQSQEDEECIEIIVTFPHLKTGFTGKWNLLRTHLIDEVHKTVENNIIDVYETEFDERFHKKEFKLKKGEFMTIYFYGKSSDNKACKLVRKEKNEVFDLNSWSYRFPKNNTQVWRIGPCGFRLQVGNATEGNWTFFGDFEWTRKRADFQITIDSSIIRNGIKFIKESQTWDEYSSYNVPLSIDGPVTYWELQKPDENILQPLVMSLNYMVLEQITNEDEGNWKVRVGLPNEVFLREQNFNVSVSTSTLTIFSRKNFFKNNKIEYSTLNVRAVIKKKPKSCTFRHHDKGIFNGIVIHNHCALNITEKPQTTMTDIWEVSVNLGEFSANGLIINSGISKNKVPYTWDGIQKIKYVKNGDELKIRCSANRPLANCSLISPNGTKYFQNSLIEKNCLKEKGICGYTAIIKKSEYSHKGNWTCEMEFEAGHRVKSLVPVKIMESYLIPEIERANSKNDDARLHCRIFPRMNYRRIVKCEWFTLDGVYLSRKKSEKYITTKKNDVCSLQLNGSSEQYFDTWICLVRLDFGGEFNSSIKIPQEFYDSGNFQPKKEINFLGSKDVESLMQSSHSYIFAIVLNVIVVVVVWSFYLNHKNQNIHSFRREKKFLCDKRF